MFSNWHFSRWIALVAGGFFAYQSLYYWEAVPAILAVFFLYQAITGSGCLGYGSCAPSMQQDQDKDETGRNMQDLEYTKIEEN